MQDLFLKTGEYMRDNILKAFPVEFQGATRQSNVSESYDMMTRPDLDKHVFMRVLEDRGAVELDAEGCAALSDWVSHVLHVSADSATTCKSKTPVMHPLHQRAGRWAPLSVQYHMCCMLQCLQVSKGAPTVLELGKL